MAQAGPKMAPGGFVSGSLNRGVAPEVSWVASGGALWGASGECRHCCCTSSVFGSLGEGWGFLCSGAGGGEQQQLQLPSLTCSLMISATKQKVNIAYLVFGRLWVICSHLSGTGLPSHFCILAHSIWNA